MGLGGGRLHDPFKGHACRAVLMEPHRGSIAVSQCQTLSFVLAQSANWPPGRSGNSRPPAARECRAPRPCHRSDTTDSIVAESRLGRQPCHERQQRMPGAFLGSLNLAALRSVRRYQMAGLARSNEPGQPRGGSHTSRFPRPKDCSGHHCGPDQHND
jgi:hypothetical protein